MGDDEGATVRTLTSYRALMTTLIGAHRGRVVDATGDNLLAEFGSVVDAVESAVEIQHALARENARLPASRAMRFRIGINLGDVIVDGERIYGDGVNIAARLESLAEAGGVCVAGTAYDQVEAKLPLAFDDLGEHVVKNIARPVRVYRVRLDPGNARPGGAAPARRRRLTLRAAWIVLGTLVVAAGAAAGWGFYGRPAGRPALRVPERPSIAVLPFVNLDGDPRHEPFADGMTEDLITALSRASNLIVIARNSVFTYKRRAVKVQQVSEELGVRYVLEGSIRTADDRVRITAQLIDATTGHHLWADGFDRPLRDIFALQDEITQHIVVALQVELTEGEQFRVWRRSATNVEAWRLTGQAADQVRRFTREGNARARALAAQAVALDAGNATAWVVLGWTSMAEALVGWSPSPERAIDRAAELAAKAIALDDSLADAYALLANVHLARRQHDRAIAEAERAVALNPNGAEVTAILASVLNYAGRPEDAIALIRKAMRLSPYAPAWYYGTLGHAYLLTGQHEQAIEALRADSARRPDNVWAHVHLVLVFMRQGREQDARDEVAAILQTDPGYSARRWARGSPYRNAADLERGLDALRRAGLPEGDAAPLAPLAGPLR
jgi:adenylate cyclase